MERSAMTDLRIDPASRDEEPGLSRRLIAAREEERALLARDLHDDVAQRLALLAIELDRAACAKPGRSRIDTFRTVRQELAALSAAIHALAYHLHPSVLDDLGLAYALRSECQRRCRQGGIDISLEIGPLPPVISNDAALCLYRVAQEALNNVSRHAGSGAACVGLKQVDGCLVLTVRDEGVGFDPKMRSSRSLGLVSMSERVRLVNGLFEIDSGPGRGTTVTACVPTDDRSEARDGAADDGGLK
jgi:signal transduction histidine kinase